MQNGIRQMTADSLLINKSLRSGQRVKFDGNIIIQGDVNPGAEVIAEGNVIVLGTLWGVVHAGANGNNNATILAFQLRPTQIRISDHFTRPPDGVREKVVFSPEIACIRNDLVIIEEYEPIK